MKEIKPIEITPIEFEQQVKTWLSKSYKKLESFTTEHREKIEGRSGEYEIDVVAKFEIFDGAEVVVLVECKRYTDPVKRDVIMVLNQKLQEIGAHKGMVFSTSGFQSGAIAFATEHKIATVTVQDGKTNYHTRSFGQDIAPPPWVPISRYIGWFTTKKPNSGEQYSLIDDERVNPVAAWFEDKEEA